MNKLRAAYLRLTNLGVTPQLKIEEAQRVRLTNTLGITPFFIYISFLCYSLIVHFYFLAILCTTVSGMVITGLYCSHKGRAVLAKSIILSSTSLAIFVGYNSMNIDFSIVSFYFPVIISYMMVFDIKREPKGFLPTFSITVGCIAGCFLLPKYLLCMALLSPDLLHVFVILNTLFALSLSVMFMFIIIDIQSNTQQKLIQAREESEMANKAKTDFLSNMSHELRTPLNGIVGSANLLMHEPASLSQKKYYEILQHSSDLMLNLINHILDFSKINERKIHLDRNVFNLHQLLSKLCRVYEAQNTEGDVQFVYHIDPQLNRDFVSDDLRLNQILVNLLTNAKKFTKKGSILFTASVQEHANHQMSILFSVKDTGIGIRPEQLEKIFESFEQADSSTTRNFGGTGLGLSICRELVKLFHSRLYVNSTPGAGSEFYFTIIADVNVETKQVAEAAAGAVKDLRGMKLLVAEDNSVNMLVLRNFLKKWNVSFDEAANGSEALVQFNKNDYDIILLDIEMPVMDGYTALAEIRKKDAATPVVAFTAALYDNMHEDLLNRGFSDHIHKPFRPNDLYDKISKYYSLVSHPERKK